MKHRALKGLLENPPTVASAVVAFVVALIAWAATELTAYAPAYVVWSGSALAAILAVGIIGRLAQRFTLPTDWLDHDDVARILGHDPEPQD